MRKSFTIALLHLQRNLTSRANLMVMFGMPLMLVMIFGVLTTGGGNQTTSKGHVYPVAVVDRDGSFASRTLIDLLQQEPSLKVQIATVAELNKLFADHKIDSGIVIPAGFQQGIAAGVAPDVNLVAAPGGNVYVGVGSVLRWQVPRLVQDYQLALKSAGAAADDAKVREAYGKIAADRQTFATTVESHAVTRVKVAAAKQLSPVSYPAVGFTVTFVMMMVFMMTGVILRERQDGTWGRLLTTPTSKAAVIGGYLLNFFLTGMIQFTILVVATRFLFQVSWGPLLPLFTVGAATVLCATGMGLFLAGLVKSAEQQAAIGMMFIIATSMLGGAYWDISMESQLMQRIGHLTPQAWAMEGFKEVMLRGGQWGALTLPLVVLLGITVVFATAGLLRVRYE